MVELTLEVEYVNPKELKPSEYSRQLFPALKGDAYEMLKRDIIENGIRTPLEINGDKIVLCGNERLRIALELGMSKVPIVHWKNGNGANQKIRIIRDNLARKAVDFRTKLKCYKELRKLYGLQSGEHTIEERNGKGQFVSPSRSSERLGLSEDEIAKEVGFSRVTMERAEKIEQSELPEEIKKAAFTGQLSIRPTADLVDEPKEVQEEVLKIAQERLKNDEHVSLETLTRDVKQKKEIAKALKKMGVPSVEEQVKDFYSKVSVPKKQGKIVKREELVKHVLNFIKQNLNCPHCGETEITWKCGHEFN